MSLTAGKQLLLSSLAGYRVSRSLRFNGSVDSTSLTRTPASAGNRKTWTWSGWIKRSALGSQQQVFGSYYFSSPTYYDTGIQFNSSDQLYFYNYDTSAWNGQLTTAAVFRDASAWYHLVVSCDTNAATPVKIYINGTQQTLSGTQPSASSNTAINFTSLHAIAAYTPISGNTQFFNGYLANVEFVDGSALTPSSFAETDATTGQWIPKLYSGSYGTNGFKLTFADNSNNTASTLGADTSGNGNNWTPNNLSVTAGAGNDSLTDTPTSYGSGTSGGDVRGNFCTANPLATTTSLTLSNGNLQVVGGLVGGATYRGNSTIGVASGKWYFETTFVSVGDNTAVGIGQSNIIDQYPGQDALSYAYVFEPAVRINSNSQVSYGSALTAGDVFMCAFDLDNNKIFFGKNGTWFGSSVPASGTNPAYTLSAGTYTPIFRPQKNSGTCEIQFNFGQRAFAYTPPANFKPLVDTYLPTPTVAKPSEVMDVIRYTGNGSTQTIPNVNTVPTTLGFGPDFVWVKKRNTSGNNFLSDTVRGTTKALISDATDAEYTNANYITAFNSDGFSVGSDSGFNTNNDTYVAWCWDAGSSTVTNTQGSITSSVRANASAGFSITTFTTQASGTATFGHGLGVAPDMFIIKARSVANNWWVYHKSLATPQSNAIALNLTDTALGSTTLWNNTAPTSTVISLDSGWAGSNTVVVYSFAAVSGYSSFGSYTANGSTDGPFVWTGFRPRFILFKRTNSTESGDWVIYDTARDPYNVCQNYLLPNSSGAEGVYANVDYLSNGFKLRSNASINTSGGTWIWAAFAESPFQYARAR